jgi:hypothetical protein
MYARRQSVLRGNFVQQFAQLSALGIIQACAHCLFVDARLPADCEQSFAPGRGQSKAVNASILGVGFACQKSTFLQPIQNGNHTAGVHIESPGEFLLADTGGAVEQAQNARLGGYKMQWTQQLRKDLRGAAAYLRQ